MDPNANLKEQREIVARLIGGLDTRTAAQQGERLADLVEALDGWIMKGGFLPKAWREANEGFNLNR